MARGGARQRSGARPRRFTKSHNEKMKIMKNKCLGGQISGVTKTYLITDFGSEMQKKCEKNGNGKYKK